MPVGTPFHARTFALCESLNYRDWSGYYAVSSYAPHHEHEYNAIRHAAALIDISPLFKYSVSGADAVTLINRLITRDAASLAVGQVCYTPWCDDQGLVVDDGTVCRLAEDRFRWTAAEPNLRWILQHASGLDVTIDDVSERTAALALQGPTSAAVLRTCVGRVDLDTLAYFRIAAGEIGGVPVEVSRTGYTGDLGYEIWLPSTSAHQVWDTLMAAGRDFGITPTGLLALDVARVEAGLLLLAVDYVGSRAARSRSQAYSPFELGLGRLVHFDKGPFVGRAALLAERARGATRRIVGLEIDWRDVEAVFDRLGLPPDVPAAASRTPVPVLHGSRQVGRASTSTWSPTLKRFIALATVEAPHIEPGTHLRFEMSVEGTHHFVGATVVPTPFLSPARKTQTPP